MTSPYLPAVPIAAIAHDAVLAVTVGGCSILVGRHGEAVFALENRCSHLDEPLACGRIRNGWIACPAHGARFDLLTGEALSGPTAAPVRTYQTRIVGDMLEIAL